MSKDKKAVKTTEGALSAAAKSIIPADYPGLLAADLRDVFPEMKGFSSSNLKYMRFFAQMCPELRIGQQPADQLPAFTSKGNFRRSWA